MKKAPKAYATNKGVSVALPATVSAVPLATIPQVKKLIAGKAENKLCGIVHQAQYNAFIDSAADAYPLLPVVPAGTGDNQRIGNRITPRVCVYLLVCTLIVKEHNLSGLFFVSSYFSIE